MYHSITGAPDFDRDKPTKSFEIKSISRSETMRGVNFGAVPQMVGLGRGSTGLLGCLDDRRVRVFLAPVLDRFHAIGVEIARRSLVTTPITEFVDTAH